MFKNLLRIFLILLITVIIFIGYLSIFGIKTDRFNDFIKTQIIKQDNRLDIEIVNIFIKLNIRERSFSLNSKNVKLFILEEEQQIKNIDVLIALDSFLKQDYKIKKIIINSQENKIVQLLKFIKAYKINIPIIYLENIVSEGKIVYDVIINFRDEKNYNSEINGKILDTKLNIFGKEKFEAINLSFKFNGQDLEIDNLKFKYKKENFISDKISINLSDNKINIKGKIQHKINSNLLSYILNYEVSDFLGENVSLFSKSEFEIMLNKKFKIKDYTLKSEITFKDLLVKLKNLKIKNYLKEFENKILFKNGKLNFKIDNNKNFTLKIDSKYILKNNKQPKDFLLNYSKKNATARYELNVDLIENEILIEEIDFHKKADEELILFVEATNNNKKLELNKIKLYNSKNNFNLENIILNKKYKILDFQSIEAKYYNKNKFFNDILINKKNNEILINSNRFDFSSNIERVLKSDNNKYLLDNFKNLNSILIININFAKLDEYHSLKNLNGDALIKKNRVDISKISGKFNSNEKFIYTKDRVGENVVTTIFSDIAKPFVKKFKFIKGFEDGKLDYVSTEINKDLSKSKLRIYDFKLQDMPALTKLLSLASLQGIADLATGEGIRFNEFEMFFDNSKNLITINEIYALGPAISIMMEGYIEKNKLVSLRGTMVPATTINKTIAKIPLLGNILVGDKAGEGIFGVSFKIKGPPENLDTRVNPIKTLTPRFITRTLEKVKKSN